MILSYVLKLSATFFDIFSSFWAILKSGSLIFYTKYPFPKSSALRSTEYHFHKIDQNQFLLSRIHFYASCDALICTKRFLTL